MRAIQKFLVGGLFGALIFSAGTASAQSLNWEGQTGVFVTPFAYTAAADAGKAGKPSIGYHFLNVGPYAGNFQTLNLTEGLGGVIEVGYTRVIHNKGSQAPLNTLWDSSFHIFHGKIKMVSENMNKNNWVPAISLGFVARTGDHNVTGVLGNKDYSSADLYIVATKTITQTKKVPVLLNFGYKATNAQIYGLAGTAPQYTGRMFGAAAFVFSLPGKNTLILASEFAQEPKHIKNLAGAVVPTTLTYAARFVPHTKAKLSIDVGVGQVANNILPGVGLAARSQLAFGLSYGI